MPALNTGWKGKLFNFKGFLDIAAFWTEYTDMVEFTFDIYGEKTGQFYLDVDKAGFKSQNVGKARINGIDASITGTGKMGPINVTTLIGFTYTNPIYLNYDSKVDTLGIEGLKVLKYRNQQLFKSVFLKFVSIVFLIVKVQYNWGIYF